MYDDHRMAAIGHDLDWAAAADQAPIDPQWLEEIFELLRIPSISASDEHKPSVRDAADWLSSYINAAGGDAEVLPLEPQPIVVARIAATAVDPDSAPTILLYAHFDVQPAGEESLWDSPPFEPEVRDGWIYARGATDDKIHLYMLVRAALDLAREGKLPVNIRVVSDGDEETEGVTVVEWLRQDVGHVDFALAFDGLMLQPGQMVFTVATRGLCFYEIEVETGERDLHSGLFGGVGLNALHVLNDMLAAVVACPEELCAGAVDVSDEQLAEWDGAEDWPHYLASAGGRPISADALVDYNRVTSMRPSVNVNGVHAGDAEVYKTIIPVKARAHVSMRLAPGQDPDVITPIFEDLLRSAAHPEATVRIVQRGATAGSYTNPELPAIQKTREAFARVVGRAPLTLPFGASVPVMAALDERGIPTVLTGFGLPDAAIHAPNERFPLAYVALGISAVREALLAFGPDGSGAGVPVKSSSMW
jgi:acetylornithine deacetylase/succinyl-diaminopimelate desuccinylase-like protein